MGSTVVFNNSVGGLDFERAFLEQVHGFCPTRVGYLTILSFYVLTNGTHPAFLVQFFKFLHKNGTFFFRDAEDRKGAFELK